MRSRPAPVVSILSIGRAVGGVAILAILLAVGGPVPFWLLTVCHACLLGNRGGEGSPVVSKGGGAGEKTMYYIIIIIIINIININNNKHESWQR